MRTPHNQNKQTEKTECGAEITLENYTIKTNDCIEGHHKREGANECDEGQ